MGTSPFDLTWIDQVAPWRGDVLREGNFFKTFEKGAWVFWDHIGQFFIEAGSGVIHSQIKEGVSELLARSFLESSIKSVSWLYQGALVLHGGAVQHKQRNIAFLGDSGAGKSTVIKQYLDNGAWLLSEDELIFPRGKSTFLRGTGQLKLWRDTPPDTGEKVFPHLEKYVMNVKKVADSFEFQYDIGVVLCWENELRLTEVISFAEKMAMLHKFLKGRVLFPPEVLHPLFPSLSGIAKKPMLIFARPINIQIGEAFEFLKMELEKYK